MKPLRLDPDLTRRVLVTLAALLLVRTGIHLPLPGLDLSSIFGMRYPGEGIMDEIGGKSGNLVDLLSLGGYLYGTPLALGLIPQLSALALMSLASVMRRTSEQQCDHARPWAAATLTLLLAASLGYGYAVSLEGVRGYHGLLVPEPGAFSRTLIAASLTAGTAFILWLTRLIDKHGIGGGVLFLLFSSAALELPNIASDTIDLGRTGYISVGTFFLVMALVPGLMAVVLLFEGAGRPVSPTSIAEGPVLRAIGACWTRLPPPRGALPLLLALGMLQLIRSLGEELLASREPALPQFLFWHLTGGTLYWLTLVVLASLFAAFRPKPQIQSDSELGAPGNGCRDHSVLLTVCGILAVCATGVLVAEILGPVLPTYFLGPVVLLLVYGTLSLVRDLRISAKASAK